jgi:hypothetical protein
VPQQPEACPQPNPCPPGSHGRWLEENPKATSQCGWERACFGWHFPLECQDKANPVTRPRMQGEGILQDKGWNVVPPSRPPPLTLDI